MPRIFLTAVLMALTATEFPCLSTAVAQTLPPPPTGGPVFAPPPLPEVVEPATRFPSLPPDPYAPDHVLPPLAEELALHGGAHLYAPEGDVAYEHAMAWSACEVGGLPGETTSVDHATPLRLPEDAATPRPLTWFSDFYGADPILLWPGRKWFGPSGYQWEPRFVAAGLYEVFGFAFEEGNRQQSAVGNQLLLDLDLQLTGTERIHAQWRPVGRKNTGGSFYQFSDPSGYVDNSTGEPDRIWFEGEVASVFGDWLDPFAPRDYVVAAGLLPFQLQNFLLLNDDVAGVVVSKNNLYVANLSNVNAQFFYFFDEVDAFPDAGAKVVGTNISIDRKHTFYELTYAYQSHGRDARRGAHYLAGAATKLYGRYTLTGRAMFKVGDESGTGDGQLYVLESNHTRIFTGGWRRNWACIMACSTPTRSARPRAGGRSAGATSIDCEVRSRSTRW